MLNDGEISLVSGGDDPVEVETITVTAQKSGFVYYAQHDGSMQNPPLTQAGTRPTLDDDYNHAPYTDRDNDGDIDMRDASVYHYEKAAENAHMWTEDGRGHTAESLYLSRVSEWVDSVQFAQTGHQ